MLNENDAEQLIRAYQNGDDEALDVLIRDCYEDIYRALRRKGLQEADAWDGTMKICGRLIKSLLSFQFKSSFKTYLSKAIYREWIDFLRKLGKRRDIFGSIDDFIHGLAENEVRRWLDFLEDLKSESPDEKVFEKELRKIVGYCLRKIKNKKHRAILILWLAGLTIRQMVEHLKFKEGMVMGNLHRKRKELRECIQKRGGLN